MKYFENIVETIGPIPLVKLNNVVETQALVLAKVESFNSWSFNKKIEWH